MRDSKALIDVHEQIATALSKTTKITVVIDSGVPGVTGLPAGYENKLVPLALSWRFGLPMILDATEIKVTLTFKGVNCDLVIPYAAVMTVAGAMVLGGQMRERASDDPARLAGVSRTEIVDDAPAPAPRTRGTLRLVKDGDTK